MHISANADWYTAQGERDGDILTFSNAWATAMITRLEMDDSDDPAILFRVEGVESKEFGSLMPAVEYAVAQLAEYQQGRAD